MKFPDWWVSLGEALMESELRPRSPTLTDAEREAIGIAAEYYSDKAADAYAHAENDENYSRIAATLRGLLERTK